jgi:DNA/RNA endonuclease YhcR with UshA esterase domain
MKEIYRLVFTLILTGLFSHGIAQVIPTYTIAQVRGDNSFEGGGADSNNVKCKLVGIVYGQNIGVTGNRLQMVLRDQTGGIGLFKNTNDLPIQIFEGDSIRAIGTINNFNGLSQITVDSIKKLGPFRPIRDPRIVTSLDESTESDLVKLEGFTLSAPASWPATPTGSGFTVKIKRNNVELDLRIDNDCNLFGAPAPSGYFNVVGLGGQFDNSIPKSSGYQLLPRNADDITPGLAPPIPAVEFVSKTLIVQESTGNVQIPLKISIPSIEQLVVQVVALDSNATNSADYTILQSGQVTFPANFGSNQVLDLNIINDFLLEGNEKFKLIIRKLAGGGTLDIGSDSVLTITITDDETVAPQVPVYNIGTIRGNNAFEGGAADSINVMCKIQGTLYGPNLRASNNGIQFVIKDASGGINIFSGTSNFGLTLQEGDSIRAIGKVSQFNGLSQLNLDSAFVLATGRPLQASVPVDSLSEQTESKLVSITGFQIVNSAQWTTGTGTGFTVQVSNGTRTIDLRIDNDCELFNQAAPSNQIISITGLGGQFDSSIPRNAGYQLLPRKASDIVLNTSVASQNRKNPISFFPNPTSGNVRMLYPEDLSNSQIIFHLFNALGQLVMEKTGTPSEISSQLSQQLQTSPAGYFNASFQVGKDFYRTTVVKN